LISQQCRIGRNPSNDLVINDRAAEDFHAVIMLSDENLIFIEDLNSRYGTIVNGERVTKVQLFPGDEVQIGFCRIDWESRTGFLPSLNEIEVIPNLSVPVKRPNQHYSSLDDTRPNNNLNHLNSGDASKDLANSLVKTEAQLDRIENIMTQDEALALQTNNETTISQIDNLVEKAIASEIEEAIPEIHVSEIDQIDEINPFSNHSDHLTIIESINENGDLSMVGITDNVPSDNNLAIELHQEINEVKIPISSDIQLNEDSKISDFSNSTSPQCSLEIDESIDEKADTLKAPFRTFSNQKKGGFISKDSLQILMIIALTCILLAAGWLLGQAS
jgi:hypothetical protein